MGALPGGQASLRILDGSTLARDGMFVWVLLSSSFDLTVHHLDGRGWD